MGVLCTAKRVRTLFALILFAAVSAMAQKDTPAASPAPPSTPVRDVKETYFGTEVTDPYRWLEDLKSPEVILLDARAKRLHPRDAGSHTQSR